MKSINRDILKAVHTQSRAEAINWFHTCLYMRSVPGKTKKTLADCFGVMETFVMEVDCGTYLKVETLVFVGPL